MLPAQTPASIRRLLRRCLAKDTRQRLHDIADARLEIETAQHEPEANMTAAVPARRSPALFVFPALVVIAAALLFAVFRPGNANEPPAWTTAANRFQIYPPPNTTFAPDQRSFGYLTRRAPSGFCCDRIGWETATLAEAAGF